MSILQIDGHPVAQIDDITAAEIREIAARLGVPDPPRRSGFQTEVRMDLRRGPQPTSVTIELQPLPAATP